MSMCRIATLLLLEIVTIVSALDTSPVLIQDEGSLSGSVKSQFNPLVKTNQEEFEAVVNTTINKSKRLLFFIEDSLAIEDISTKDEKGTPLLNMKNAYKARRALAFPRVVEPYRYLEKRFSSFDLNTFHVRPSGPRPILGKEDSLKFMYIFFDDDKSSETRIQKLRRHDTIIKEMFDAVAQQNKGPVAAVYTGKYNWIDKAAIKKRSHNISAAEENPNIKNHIAQCGSATIEIDAEMQDTDGKLSSLIVVHDCEYDALNKDTWTYRIKLKHLESVSDVPKKEGETVPINMSITFSTTTTFNPIIRTGLQSLPYELILTFSYNNTYNPEAGWQLKKIAYLSPNKRTLKTQLIGNSADWDHPYENQKPLILLPAPEFRYSPTLMIKSHKINMRNAKARFLKQEIEYDMKDTVKDKYMFAERDPEIISLIETEEIFRDTRVKEGIITVESRIEWFTSIDIIVFEMVLFLFLAIVFFGLYMIMGISTNDIYDSPGQNELLSSKGDTAE